MQKTTRRNLLIGGAAAAVAAGVGKPGDKGGPYPEYFARLNQTLRKHGIDRPVLVIDMDRLDRNIDRVAKSVATVPGRAYRIAVKSIPSPALVDYVARRAGTQSLMNFHRPFVQAMATLRPDSDILLGKPMPVDAVNTFYEGHKGAFDPSKQLQWLIDTDARLAQYLALAKAKNLKMRINCEIDVGLRRGGFGDPAALASALQTISDNPQHLEFAGFMGYDAHVPALPGPLIEGEKAKVRARYAACVDLVKTRFAPLAAGKLTLNAAGSPTFRSYEGDASVNDLTAGSVLMKPSQFDIPDLDAFEASAFIASPVLKHQKNRIPALDWLSTLMSGWNPNLEDIYFGYGGHWLADCEAPPGVAPHFAYTSTNQQGYTAPRSVSLKVDDFIFLRPKQSEAVLLQFGDLVAVRGDKIEARWPVLPVGI